VLDQGINAFAAVIRSEQSRVEVSQIIGIGERHPQVTLSLSRPGRGPADADPCPVNVTHVQRPST
jgi:hypothetical protein